MTALALMRGETSSGSTSSSTAIGDTERVLGGIRTFEALVQVGMHAYFSGVVMHAFVVYLGALKRQEAPFKSKIM